MTTTEIRGLFSKEHSVLVILIFICLYGAWKNYQTQNTLLVELAEIKADIKVLTYQIDHGKTKKQLAKGNIDRCKRKSKFQKANSSIIGFLYPYWRNSKN